VHDANDYGMIVTKTQYTTAPSGYSRTIHLLQSVITTREKEILVLMARGYTSAEIASSLFISDHTVITHRKNLMAKLDARNSAHLVMKGVRLRLLT